MKEYIYINSKNGNLVDQNYPNSVCYVRMDYVHALWEAEDKANSLSQLVEDKDHEIGKLKTQIHVLQLTIQKMENEQGRYHDDQSVFKHS